MLLPMTIKIENITSKYVNGTVETYILKGK